MVTADVIVLICGLLSLAAGALFGFGNMFKFAIKGIFGAIVCTYLSYLIANMMYGLPFIQEYSQAFNGWIGGGNNPFTDFLVTLRLDFIVLVIIIDAVLLVLRGLIAKAVEGIMEIDKPVMKVINRVTGAIFTFALMFTFLLLAFQIISLVNGGTSGDYYLTLSGSAFKLDELYTNNPLKAFF